MKENFIQLVRTLDLTEQREDMGKYLVEATGPSFAWKRGTAEPSVVMLMIGVMRSSHLLEQLMTPEERQQLNAIGQAVLARWKISQQPSPAAGNLFMRLEHCERL